MPFKADVIATILHAPLANVEANWPLVQEALASLKILDQSVEVAAIASIGSESYVFAPEKEAGTEAYFRRMYEFDRRLGNLEPGDGVKYCGRGFVPVLGRSEYARFGKLVGTDLVAQPELALDPAVAARILAYDFMLKGVPKAAAEDDWVKVRRLVHGDLSGWKRFNGILIPLLKLLPPMTAG
jgi:predicted chitinase